MLPLALAELVGIVDTDAVTTAWEGVLEVPGWHGPPVWTHGDLLPGNLLVRSSRISGVIDFSCMGVGDPACDLIVAWALLSAQTRDVFRAALTVDDATWTLGRDWALSIGLIALPYYQNTNPPVCRDSPEDDHRGPDRLALKQTAKTSLDYSLLSYIAWLLRHLLKLSLTAAN